MNNSFEKRIDADLQDRTSHVIVRETEEHRWDVKCYSQSGNRLEYIGGATNLFSFDKACAMAEFYAPCKEAIRIEVGVPA